MAGRNLVPMTDNESDLGSPTKRWKDIYATNIVGTIIGNSDTATALEVPRSISLTGDVSGSVLFDGSADASITATVADDSHNHVISNVDGLQTALDGMAASSHTHAGADVTSAVENATNATTASACSGNAATATKLATARTISLTGDVSGSAYFDGSANAAITATVANDSHTHIGGNITSAVANATTAAACSGNAATATKLATARTISLTGDVTGSASFDGSDNASITATVADDSHNHTIANVDSLQSELDGKAESSHTHAGTDVTSAVANATTAETATKLATARTISLTGDVTGSASFDGSDNASITATVADDSHNHTIANVDGLQTTLDGKAESSHTHAGTDVTSAVANATNATTAAACSGNAATATKLATARTISLTGDVTGSSSFDGSANAAITATVANDSHTHIGGNITSAVANATTAASCSGNAATATKLATARTISLTGDVTGSASFDGSDNAAITATVADDSHNHTIANVDSLQTTLDGKVPTGRTVTAGNGMTGGGALSGNITLTMGTPSSITSSSTNSVTSTSHTHAITGFSLDDHIHSDYIPFRANDIADLNSAIEDGIYSFYGSTNTPDGFSGYGEVYVSTRASGAVSQIFITRVAGETGKAYFRYSFSNVWYAWKCISVDGHTHVGGDVTSAVANATTAASCSGNSATATKLATARTISLTGDVTGSASFDGSANASITATVADDSHNHVISNVDGLQTALDGRAASSHTHVGTDVTSAVANATTAAACSGNAETATKLATARTISLTGDVTGSASFDGSDNASITATVADDSHNHTIANVDGLQTELDGKPNILSERSLSVTTTNWVTIATCSTGRAYGEFYVYDADGARHNMVKIIASASYGQNAVVALCGNRYSSRTIAHVRILYNTADRTYGGAKLQVYCESPTFTLRVRRIFTDQLSGWTSWNDVNPVVEGTPSGWAEDSTTRFDDITSTAYSLNGNLSGNATTATTAASCSGNAATATKLSGITTTFTGTYPLTVNVNGVIYSHTGITYSGSGNTLTAGTFSGDLSGNASSATISTTSTTTEDTTNELILVGVTSGATTTLKRDTNVTVTNDSIKANNFKMGTSAYMTYNSSTECVEFIFN